MFLDVAVLAVLRILIAVVVGALVSDSIPHHAFTMRDLGFLITNVLVPCLTLSSTAKTVDLDIFRRCSVLFGFSLLVIVTGLVCAHAWTYVCFRVKGKHRGVPLQYVDDVRLDLMYDLLVDSPASEESAPTTSSPLPASDVRMGRPYVAVLLSDRLRSLDQDAIGQIVASLEVPSVETEDYPKYAGGVMLGCSIQNTMTVPLSLMQSLASSVPWLDLDLGMSYVFVYRIIATLYFWGVGPFFVERSYQQSTRWRRIRELVHRHRVRQGIDNIPSQTEADTTPAAGDTLPTPVPDASPLPAFPREEMANAPPYNWESEGLVRVFYASDVFGGRTSAMTSLRRVMGAVCDSALALSRSFPFMSIVVGLVIGLVPPIRALFFGGGPLEMFMDGMEMVAKGAVPSSVLLLGSNLVSSTKLSAEGARTATDTLATAQVAGEGVGGAVPPTSRPASPATGEASRTADPVADSDSVSAAPLSFVSRVRHAMSLSSVPQAFVWGTVAVRLVFAPALGFLVVVLLLPRAPTFLWNSTKPDKTLLMVIFMQLSTPTAINSGLLFEPRRFMLHPWAKLLFIEYALCSFTIVAWTTLALSMVERW